MAGAGLIDLKRRIKSVTSTRKITKAMGLVATSRLRKLRNALKHNEEYFKYIEEVKDDIVNKIQDKDNLYIKGNDVDRKLFIMLSSDTGLCGGYNSNVTAKLYELCNHEEDPLIMVIGQKGISYLKKYGLFPTSQYVQMSEAPTAKEAKTIYNHALRLFKEGTVGEVSIVYTDFISSIRQEVKVQKLLPLSNDDNNNDDDLDDFKDNETYLVEYDKESSLQTALNLYLMSLLHKIMLQSKCSEYSSRMTAMDSAAKNANDILDKLNSKFNRIRQSAITQEITEIVSGAEAQK